MAFIAPLPLPFRRLPSLTTSVRPPSRRRPRLHRPRLPNKFTPTASQQPLVLTEENVNIALEEARQSLGSMFGNNQENRSVGITGEVQLVSLDGPVVILRLSGRFWHKRADVLARVSTYLSQRIPEICDTAIEDPAQLDDSLQQ